MVHSPRGTDFLGSDGSALLREYQAICRDKYPEGLGSGKADERMPAIFLGCSAPILVWNPLGIYVVN